MEQNKTEKEKEKVMGILCESCKHWNDIRAGNRIGECRKNPPQVIVTSGSGLHAKEQICSKFPIMSASDWCGAWEEM